MYRVKNYCYVIFSTCIKSDVLCVLIIGLAGTVYFYCDLINPKTAKFPAFELPSVS